MKDWKGTMTLLRNQLFPSTSSIKEPTTKNWADKLIHMLDDLIKKIVSIPFNRSEILEISDTGTANTEFSIAHHLIRIPKGFIVVRIDKAASVYASGTTWTKTTIYLECSLANSSIKLCVF